MPVDQRPREHTVFYARGFDWTIRGPLAPECPAGRCYRTDGAFGASSVQHMALLAALLLASLRTTGTARGNEHPGSWWRGRPNPNSLCELLVPVPRVFGVLIS